MKCVGYTGAPCPRHVDPAVGGARCNGCRPVNLMHLVPPPPVEARRGVIPHEDIADALRRHGGNVAAVAREVGCTRQSVRERVRRSEILTLIRDVAARGAQ